MPLDYQTASILANVRPASPNRVIFTPRFFAIR